MNNLKQNATILITDVNSRKGFDVYNVFKQIAKHDFLLTSSVDNNLQLPIVYLQKVHKLRIENYHFFENDLEKICKLSGNNQIVYIPVSDSTNKLFYTFLESKIKYAKQFIYLLPQQSSYDITLNKLQFQNYCESNNFAVPKSYSFLNIKQNIAKYPLIVKPTIGAGSVGIKRLLSAADNDILNELKETDYVVQEIIGNSNNVEGAFFLCNNGEIVSYYSHTRIRTYPTNGGVTVYSKSNQNESLKTLGGAILKKLNWSGYAMVEFLYDEINKEYKIIEINPRIWGSFMLSEFCGTNFALNYLNIALNKPVITPEYKEKNIRWLYPFDILNYIKSKFSLKGFWDFDKENTCYINATYANYWSIFTFMIYFTINFSSIKRLCQKLYGK
ncbi:MAG: ATP-grasp domain-containing protein [Ferruginibacter sp.]|nr:ATP-grasp domain-containing protein [Ferruginibacter sp.]